MHRRVYDSLKTQPKLQNKKVNLNSVSGDSLKIDGSVNLAFSIGGTEMQHTFFVVREINRNLILGSDWLRQNGVRIYYDLGCLRVGDKTYVNLEEDIHISSVVRSKYTTVLKANTATICYGKVRQNPDLPERVDYNVSSVDRGFISKEPGLEVINSISCLRKDRSIPILVVNKTNRTLKIFRHGIVAKVESLNGHNVAEVNSVFKDQKFKEDTDFNDVDVSEEAKDLIQDLISKK